MSMLLTEPPRIALYTKPRFEKRVAAKMEELGFEHYLPLQRQLHQWSDRTKWVEIPLFTSYIFARVTAKQEVPIRNVPGVVMPISFKGEVAVIPDRDIEAIRSLVAHKEQLYVRNAMELRKGAYVRIIGGPLRDMEGYLVSDDTNGNFAVEIHGLNVMLVSEVQADLLELIPPDKTKKKPKEYHF